MAFERLVGLHVVDDDAYQAYRNEMTPILHSYGGDFGYDFKIAAVLRSKTEAPINRVFTIFCPDEATMTAFFADEKYLEIRKRHFDRAVRAVTVIAVYERE